MRVMDATLVHFVGIGGAGMSALATVLLERGRQVSGSDVKDSDVIRSLQSRGAAVFTGHDASNVAGADLVIVSNAVPSDNVEVLAASAAAVPVITRGQALAEILAPSSAVVVAGTHGKTTTTAMIVAIARAAGADPTYLIGAGFDDDGANAHSGSGDLAIAESDESDGSFLLLTPQVAVITNIDADHLDHWQTEHDYRAAFVEFAGRIRPEGTLVAPAAEPDLLTVAREGRVRTLTFGVEGDVRAEDVTLHATGTDITLVLPRQTLTVRLQVAGAHNVDNALAAAAAAAALDIGPDAIKQGLESHRGVDRRFQLRGTPAGRTVIDDYAHHPVEVRAVLAAARAPGSAWERVVAVFQPHRYSRTAAFAAEFGTAFANADRVVITDVYGAGEPPISGVTGKLVADAVCARLPGRPVAYIPEREQLVSYLVVTTRPGDLVLTLGAGDVTTLAGELELALEHR